MIQWYNYFHNLLFIYVQIIFNVNILNFFQIVLFFGHLILSYLLAFAISLSFEAPVVTMLKILTPNRKKILVENRD